MQVYMENQDQEKEGWKFATIRINVSAVKGHLISLRLSCNPGQKWETKPVLWFSLFKRESRVGLSAALDVGLKLLL